MGLLDAIRDKSDDAPLPSSAFECSGREERRVVRGALLRIGLATSWDRNDPVPALTKRQYCNAVRVEVDSDEHGHYLKREDLLAVARHLGISGAYDMTNSELRKALSRRAGHEPGTGDDAKAGLRKAELHGVAMEVLREGHEG